MSRVVRHAWDRLRAAAVHPAALVAVSLLVLALLQWRHHYEPFIARAFLVWNLFLAWIPYVCALLLARLGRARAPFWTLVPLGAIWLAFLPNAPYLVTDVVHVQRDPSRLVYDIPVFAVVALAGVLLGVASLQPVHRLVAERYGATASIAFPPLIAAATGFGVYLGRVQRWNSWSFVQTPGRLAHAAGSVLVHPVSHPRAVGGTALFAAAFLLAYIVLTYGRIAPSTRRHATPS
jgi:uncharacterized membrane protein